MRVGARSAPAVSVRAWPPNSSRPYAATQLGCTRDAGTLARRNAGRYAHTRKETGRLRRTLGRTDGTQHNADHITQRTPLGRRLERRNRRDGTHGRNWHGTLDRLTRRHQLDGRNRTQRTHDAGLGHDGLGHDAHSQWGRFTDEERGTNSTRRERDAELSTSLLPDERTGTLSPTRHLALTPTTQLSAPGSPSARAWISADRSATRFTRFRRAVRLSVCRVPLSTCLGLNPYSNANSGTDADATGRNGTQPTPRTLRLLKRGRGTADAMNSAAFRPVGFTVPELDWASTARDPEIDLSRCVLLTNSTTPHQPPCSPCVPGTREN